jgi:hypothetical protein
MKMGIVARFKALKGLAILGFKKGVAKNRLKHQIKQEAILPTYPFSFELGDEVTAGQVIVSDDWVLASGLSIPPELPGCGINLDGLIIVNEAFMKESDEFKLIGILHELEHIRLEHHKNMDNAVDGIGRLGEGYIEADIEADHAVAEKVGKEAYLIWLKYFCAKVGDFMAVKYNLPENELFRQRIEALEVS